MLKIFGLVILLVLIQDSFAMEPKNKTIERPIADGKRSPLCSVQPTCQHTGPGVNYFDYGTISIGLTTFSTFLDVYNYVNYYVNGGLTGFEIFNGFYWYTRAYDSAVYCSCGGSIGYLFIRQSSCYEITPNTCCTGCWWSLTHRPK
jgi:hypothetical protein